MSHPLWLLRRGCHCQRQKPGLAQAGRGSRVLRSGDPVRSVVLSKEGHPIEDTQNAGREGTPPCVLNSLQPILPHKGVQFLLRLLILRADLAHGHGVEDGFLCSVQGKGLVGDLRLHGGDGAAAQADGGGGRKEVQSRIFFGTQRR